MTAMDPAIVLVLRGALALLFLIAAAHKARDPGRFRAVLADYRLLPARLVAPAAVALPAVEGTLAAALCAPGQRAPGLVGAAALLLLYAGAMAVNLARGRRDVDCGCMGPAAHRPIAPGLVARNVALAAAAVAGLVPTAPRPLVWVDAVTAAGGTAALAALWGAAGRLLANRPALARLRGTA
ncbi:MAG TPA: MauE/DoxX family redox-associated membrane protein [Candidatus Binatia bacterium]|nr:MauE/DoxX family redox-associated membrane protein [Candidatus Binatia bacterium]